MNKNSRYCWDELSDTMLEEFRKEHNDVVKKGELVTYDIPEKEIWHFEKRMCVNKPERLAARDNYRKKNKQIFKNRKKNRKVERKNARRQKYDNLHMPVNQIVEDCDFDFGWDECWLSDDEGDDLNIKYKSRISRDGNTRVLNDEGEYEIVLADDEEYESTEEEREFREKRQKKFRQEQRFAICAGLYLSHLPNDLARLIAAYAIPNSKIYDYMHTS